MVTIRRIYQAVTSVLVGLMILLAILLAGVRLFGLTPYTVISGSMEPTYHVGSLLYVRASDPYAFSAGDPITYKMPDGQVVTHRVEEVVEGETGISYRTKGDANETADGTLLSPMNVIGRPVATLPLLGYVSYFVQNPPGTYVALAGVVVLVVLTLLPDFLFPKKKEEEDPADPAPAGEDNNG